MSAKNGKTNGHKNGNGSNGHKAPGEEPSSPRNLTGKQEKWLEVWYQTGNATEAARQAGYQGNDDVLASIRQRNLRHHEVQSRIAERRAEAKVDSDEVIGNLAAIARGNILDAFEDSDSPHVKRLREKNLGHLIRKIRIKRTTEKRDGKMEPIEIMELEFHNSLAASSQLCKVLGIERAPVPADNAEAILDKATEALVLLTGVDSAQARELLQKAQQISTRLM